MSIGGPGALMRMKVHPMPVGTPEELQQEGMSLADIGCCAPPSPGVRGCPWWDDCPFDRRNFNQGKWTKGEGPHYVGYSLITHERVAARDFQPCFVFTGTMLGRIKGAQMAAAEGLIAEHIRVIAQEGDTIRRKQFVQVSPGEPMKGYKETIQAIEIPRFPRPSEMAELSFDAEVISAERDYERAQANALERVSDETFKVFEKISDKVHLPPPVSEPAND